MFFSDLSLSCLFFPTKFSSQHHHALQRGKDVIVGDWSNMGIVERIEAVWQEACSVNHDICDGVLVSTMTWMSEAAKCVHACT